MNAISKSLKMFVSYSHKDKEFLKELEAHLATVNRNGIVKEWTDKELVVGDHLDSEIKQHLLNADLIAFLVSSDFLASWCCYEVELKETLGRLKNKEFRIIPIIVRACDWKGSELGQYVAVPEDGKPVSEFEHQDKAWVQVVESIKNSAKKHGISKNEKESDIHSSNKQPALNSDFAKKLNDTEVIFQNRNKEQVLLDDIFVFPDLKNIKQELDELQKIKNSIFLTISENSPKKILILGGEQSGKTSLAKTVFKAYYEDNRLPLYCNGSNINSTKVENLLGKLLAKQYHYLTYDNYILQKRERILIVDDYDQFRLSIRLQGKLLENLINSVDRLVLFANSSIKYMEAKYIELSDYMQYEILPFGNARRYELIKKWICIGVEETKDDIKLHKETDAATCHVDAIIRKNIVPPKPFYILSIIQLIDTVTPSNYTLTSYGHCYQTLIQAALNKVKIKANEYDVYLNYSSELAYFIFTAGGETIDDDQLVEFKEIYSNKFLLESHEEVIDILLKSGILRENEGRISFSYRYIFYFYVAKHIADNLIDDSCKKHIEELCENLHTEKNANILIFLVHHSKNQCVTDEILLTALTIFDKLSPATLNIADTEYLFKYMKTIPSLVGEQKDIDEERIKRLEKKDAIEGPIDGSDEEIEIESTEPNEASVDSLHAEINRSVRIVEVIGQILRNRHGSLTKEQLKDLTLSAYSSGLKFLNFFLNATNEDQSNVIKFIESRMQENSNLSNDVIAKMAKKFFLMLCYGTSFSVVRKIANSLGTEKLLAIYRDISDDHPDSPAHHLIEVAIHLEFAKNIPKELMKRMYGDLDGNPIGQRLLQELVVQHSYLNHIDYKDKQWISDKLGVQMSPQKKLPNKP